MLDAVSSNSLDDIDRAVSALAPIDLSEMDSVSLMNRVDTKYTIPERLLPGLLRSVSDTYRVLEVAGGRRSPYSSLYFDTPALDCYLEHHNGKACRRKFRMRCYTATGVSFFEIKLRTNKGRTVKRRIAIPTIVPSLDGGPAKLVEEATGRSLDLTPQIATEFSRITLVANDYAERVTIDTNLEFRRDANRAALQGTAVIEVKQERDSRDSPIRQQLRKLQMRPMRMSKYCIGSALLDPGLKRNRFKRKFLALQSLVPS